MDKLTIRLIVDEKELFSATGFLSEGRGDDRIMDTFHETNIMPRYNSKLLFPKPDAQFKIREFEAYKKLSDIAKELFSDKKYTIESKFESVEDFLED